MDSGQSGGQGDNRQCGVIPEGLLGDGGDTFGNGDGGELGATLEGAGVIGVIITAPGLVVGIVQNGGPGQGQLNTGQGGDVIEGPGGHGGNG